MLQRIRRRNGINDDEGGGLRNPWIDSCGINISICLPRTLVVLIIRSRPFYLPCIILTSY